jgi:hypothetical protein
VARRQQRLDPATGAHVEGLDAGGAHGQVGKGQGCRANAGDMVAADAAATVPVRCHQDTVAPPDPDPAAHARRRMAQYPGRGQLAHSQWAKSSPRVCRRDRCVTKEELQQCVSRRAVRRPAPKR